MEFGGETHLFLCWGWRGFTGHGEEFGVGFAWVGAGDRQWVGGMSFFFISFSFQDLGILKFKDFIKNKC